MQPLQSSTSATDTLICEPILFDLAVDSDEFKIEQLLKDKPYIKIVDEIESQLLELLKLRSPSRKFTDAELLEEVNTFLKDTTAQIYGKWVYYQWLEKIVHVLDESDFIEVRTNRNHYKITPEEEAILHKKRIGVIGLSVGKAIALTIATERICGTLVIADFDVIELSNLNRIQTGVQNINTKKNSCCRKRNS
ncbi:MAG: hypothetical protein ACI8SE_001795 [Bacteroidia bacterium]|jgi:hypothetical protein